MPCSALSLIKRCAEFRIKDECDLVAGYTRGIYVLYKYRPRLRAFDVVYVGLARGGNSGVRSRLRAHRRSKKKRDVWTHFSVFEVWDNISDSQVAELEGLFRHIYRKDARAIRLNVQKRFSRLAEVRQNKLVEW